MGFFVVASMGSNRTFMELKFDVAIDSPGGAVCSNRTFMELKSTLLMMAASAGFGF